MVGLCYRSPTSSPANNDKLLQVLDKTVCKARNEKLLLLGDFNYPAIDYNTFSVHPGDKAAAEFFDKTLDLFLCQHVNEPTRIRQAQKPSTLDYIFTDEDELIVGVNYLPPLGKSDHVCIEFQYVLGEADLDEPVEKLNYWKADYDKINEALSLVDWSVEFKGKDCNEMWENFREKTNTIVLQHVPFKKVRNTQEKSPWMTRLTRRMIKKRNKAWNIYRQFSSTRNFNRYKSLRNRVCK